MRILPLAFYEQPTLVVAQTLLGKYLVHNATSGRIVEVEAYLGGQDPASHGFKGPTPRTKSMFGPAGHAYVYFTYGMHYCVNVVCAPIGQAEAILIRALEPRDGIPLMQERRQKKDLVSLCNGPAKLVQALAIGRENDGQSLQGPNLYIAEDLKESLPLPTDIQVTTRIGISQAKDLPLRFYLKGSPYVSCP